MIRKSRRLWVISLSVIILSLILTACGDNQSEATETKDIKIGISPGPYGDMIQQAIAPYMEQLGYTIEVVQFTDYVQPNQALASGETEANLMQHSVYLAAFAEDNNLDIGRVIIVPTAGMGIFSDSIESLEDIPEGARVAMAVDASNLARSLRFLKALDLIDFNPDIDEARATVHDVTDNPLNLQFVTMDAAQIYRSLDSVELGMIPGNFAIAAGLNLADALAVERLAEDYKNVVAVRTPDIDGQLGRDLKAAVESEEFREAIEREGSIFQAFDRPQWWIDKYGE